MRNTGVVEREAGSGDSRLGRLSLEKPRSRYGLGSGGWGRPGILQARTLEWVAISFSNARK